MNSLIVPLILCFTVIASVSFGILAAYVAVFSILSTFRHSTEAKAETARPRLVLVPTQTHASGD